MDGATGPKWHISSGSSNTSSAFYDVDKDKNNNDSNKKALKGQACSNTITVTTTVLT